MKASVAKALFSPICNFFFSKDYEANAVAGATLRCTVRDPSMLTCAIYYTYTQNFLICYNHKGMYIA